LNPGSVGTYVLIGLDASAAMVSWTVVVSGSHDRRRNGLAHTLPILASGAGNAGTDKVQRCADMIDTFGGTEFCSYHRS
jgi:hypothetical protein